MELTPSSVVPEGLFWKTHDRSLRNQALLKFYLTAQLDISIQAVHCSWLQAWFLMCIQRFIYHKYQTIWHLWSLLQHLLHACVSHWEYQVRMLLYHVFDQWCTKGSFTSGQWPAIILSGLFCGISAATPPSSGPPAPAGVSGAPAGLQRYHQRCSSSPATHSRASPRYPPARVESIKGREKKIGRSTTLHKHLCYIKTACKEEKNSGNTSPIILITHVISVVICYLAGFISSTVEPLYNEVLGTMKITLLYQVSHYIRVKKQRNIKSWDQQNYLVIRGFCYIRPRYNEVPL